MKLSELDLQGFKEFYSARLAHYDRTINKTRVNGDYIEDQNFDGTLVRVKVADCMAIVKIYTEFRAYIYALKVGDTILIDHYGRVEQATIKRINYSRKVTRSGKPIISTMTVKTEWSETKIETENIKWRGNLYYDVREAYAHASCHFGFWNKYDAKNVTSVIFNYNQAAQ